MKDVSATANNKINPKQVKKQGNQENTLWKRILKSEKLEKRLSVKLPEFLTEISDEANNDKCVCKVCF